MFKKNTAVTGFQIGNFISATDGSTVTTGTPTCKRTLDGTPGSCANAASYNATALAWLIDLAQGDLNGDMVGLSFTLTGCLPINYTIRTATKLVSDLNDIAAGAKMDIVDAPSATGAAALGLAFWHVLAASVVTLNSIGLQIKTALDAAVSTRSTYAGADTAGTTTLLGRIVGTLDTGTHKPQSGDSYARLGLPAGASIAADLAEIEGETDGVASIPTADQNAVALLDKALSGHTTTGTAGGAISTAGAASDPLLNQVPGSYAAGTAGNILGRLGRATIAVSSPITAAGDIMIVQGDDYLNADGRAILWTESGSTWPALDGTVKIVYGKYTKTLTIVSASTPKSVRWEPTAAETAAMVADRYTYGVYGTDAGGHEATFIQGNLRVVRRGG